MVHCEDVRVEEFGQLLLLSSRILHEEACQMKDSADREIEALEETAGAETTNFFLKINQRRLDADGGVFCYWTGKK